MRVLISASIHSIIYNTDNQPSSKHKVLWIDTFMVRA